MAHSYPAKVVQLLGGADTRTKIKVVAQQVQFLGGSRGSHDLSVDDQSDGAQA